MASVNVLTLDSDDIKGHLNCNDKTVNRILGMAKDGKFSDIIMDDFWLTIETCANALKNYSQSAKEYYEKLGES